MLDLFHDHLNALTDGHVDLTDHLGMPMARIDTFGDGLAMHDTLGHTLMHAKAVGGHVVQYGELGQVLGSWHEVGNQLVHHTPLGLTDQYVTLQGNHFVGHDSLGMPQWQFDPLSGAISNSLGMVQAFLKGR